MKMNKKGQIEALQGIIIPLVGIALVLMVGFLIFSEVKDKSTELGTDSNESVNLTVTWTNNTYVALGNSGNCMALSCGDVYNGTTNGDPLATTFYDCSNEGIRVKNTSLILDQNMINEQVNVTSTCTYKSTAYNATGTIQNATADIPGWLPIIVITIIGALLLSLVSVFRGKR